MRFFIGWLLILISVIAVGVGLMPPKDDTVPPPEQTRYIEMSYTPTQTTIPPNEITPTDRPVTIPPFAVSPTASNTVEATATYHIFVTGDGLFPDPIRRTYTPTALP